MGWYKIQLGKLGKTYTGLSGKSKDDFGSGKPYIPYMNVFTNSRINPYQLEYVQIKKEENQNQVKYGDLVFTTSSETVEEVGMASILLDDIGEVYLNSFCFGFRLNDFETLLPEFAQYLFHSQEVRYKISLQGQGSTRYNLSKTELLKKLILSIPNKAEQTRIAQILSKADAAITQTEALIAKYQSIKTGLMQDLLTEGIDEQGSIRSKTTHRFVVKNGMEVPEEWEVDILKKFCERIQDGTHFSPKIDANGSYKYITSKNIRMGFLDLADLEYINEFEHRKIFNRCPVKCGDVLLTKDGANTGNICLNNINEEFSLLSSVAMIRGKKEILSNGFILQYFMNGRGQRLLTDQMSGNAITRITLTKINNTLITVPSIGEQSMITNKLRIQDEIIEVERANLSKLQSLKTGLMQDLLSGKVMVKMKEEVTA